MKKSLVLSLGVIAALGISGTASSAMVGISDPVGDFLPTFGGSPATSGDLDILNATVLYDSATQLFKLSTTVNAAPGTTAANLYVWGLNQGTGVVNSGFAANGVDGVRFNRVITFTAAATSITGLGGSTVMVAGNGIDAIIPLASLGLPPAGSFANPLDYTWNIWSRNTTFAGFAAIADFAPNNANFTTTAGPVTPVPLPPAFGLLTLALASIGMLCRRGERSTVRRSFLAT